MKFAFTFLFTFFLISTAEYDEILSTTSDPLEGLIETPNFLKAATDSQRKAYIELESNPNLSLDMKAKALANWAEKCEEPVKSLYISYANEKNNLEMKENQRMSQIVNSLSPAAQKADKEVRAISTNKNLTKKQIDAKVEKKLSGLPKKVYYELTFATQ